MVFSKTRWRELKVLWTKLFQLLKESQTLQNCLKRMTKEYTCICTNTPFLFNKCDRYVSINYKI